MLLIFNYLYARQKANMLTSFGMVTCCDVIAPPTPPSIPPPAPPKLSYPPPLLPPAICNTSTTCVFKNSSAQHYNVWINIKYILIRITNSNYTLYLPSSGLTIHISIVNSIYWIGLANNILLLVANQDPPLIWLLLMNDDTQTCIQVINQLIYIVSLIK